MRSKLTAGWTLKLLAFPRFVQWISRSTGSTQLRRFYILRSWKQRLFDSAWDLQPPQLLNNSTVLWMKLVVGRRLIAVACWYLVLIFTRLSWRRNCSCGSGELKVNKDTGKSRRKSRILCPHSKQTRLACKYHRLRTVSFRSSESVE